MNGLQGVQNPVEDFQGVELCVIAELQGLPGARLALEAMIVLLFLLKNVFEYE